VVTLPRELCDGLELRAGDAITFSKKGNGILIKRRRDPDDVLTPKEALEMKKSMSDIAAGKYVTLDELRRKTP
jgi:antitoxin component of MazEF toxin-antitoxin module